MSQATTEHDTTPENNNSYIKHVLCGLMMGAADAVPGVSGGTVALVLGIYNRLVTAISHVDRQLFRHIKKREWAEVAKRLDLKFVIPLGMGIAVGLLVFVMAIHELIEDDQPARPYVFALFFGAIIGSSYLVARLVKEKSSSGKIIALLGLGILGACFAFWITSFEEPKHIDSAHNLGFLFICGTIAISAMILPGISGSYLLIIFGVFNYLSGIPKALLKGQADPEGLSDDLLAFAVFAVGCLVGLLCFSKVLRWLLKHYEPQTMAIMCGFMIGAIRKLWPWEKTAPDSTSEVIGCIVIIIIATVGVIGIDLVVRRMKNKNA
ncbi:MAG: hypothetical protein COA78_11575 [Blastopirellula sp.]|nr:MAG: hypothetical protein COA78_11575 [Blastopirellula sp.]